MKKFVVEIHYEMVHTVEVVAETKEDAIDIAETEWLDADLSNDSVEKILSDKTEVVG